MHTNASQIKIVVQQTCQQTLGFFIKNMSLSQTNFPILSLTYTLWRKYAFKSIMSQFKNVSNSQTNQIVKCFYLFSEKKHLPQYIQRIKGEMNMYCRGVKKVQQNIKQLHKLPQKQEQMYETLIQIGETVWTLQLYIEMIQDLIHLPYLQVIPSKSSIDVKPQYATDYIFSKKKTNKISSIANSAGKNIFNKILSSVTQVLFSKAFVLKINTLLGSFNPLVIGASFGLNSYLQHLDTKKKNEQLEVQLQQALAYSQTKSNKVQQIYKQCFRLIEQIIYSDGLQHEQNQSKRKKLKSSFLQVFQEEWLHIQISRQADGWQFVRMEEKQSFQQLSQ